MASTVALHTEIYLNPGIFPASPWSLASAEAQKPKLLIISEPEPQIDAALSTTWDPGGHSVGRQDWTVWNV